jgi:potassium efflux system protein
VRLGKLFSAVFAIAVLAGLGVIWNDVLPAFGVLSKVRLWQSSEALEVVNGVTEYEWITLREILLAGLTLVLTFFAATNIPALLEFAVLPRLPFDSGTRYAISTVLRYLITVPGVALAVSVLGFGWANIQWLVAAMTVGLGFGLQEIFANFVSGLILLFERPIRIGDTVTVGDVTGTVTRIRIRATTIVDWDRKELVVPNREFVTGQLVNWTLSDAVLRVVVRVGIAYGSDTRLATKLLYQVAADNDDVLEDPPPKVIFSAFGSSSLDFELRCFVSSPQQWRVISHELNLAIDDLFRQNNIEIAFPQQDLHVRSIDIKARDIIPGAL